MSLNAQNINYSDFKNICRTCLINCESKSIRQENIIIEILHNLTGVRFETNDELPKQICLNCFEKINEIHAFSSQCKQTHFNLIKCLNNYKNKQLAQEKEHNKLAEEKKNKQFAQERENKNKQLHDKKNTQIKNEMNKIEFIPVNNYYEETENLKIKEEMGINDYSDTEKNDFQENLLLPITDIDSNDSEMETSPDFTEAEKYNLIPLKSKKKYEGQYNLFMNWRLKNRTSSFSDKVLLIYFQNLAKTRKPSSLWSIYSMLRMTIKVKNNVDISENRKLCAFLKRISNGYKPKKSLILTPEQIQQFLVTAPDEIYLFIKVALIFGMVGGCRRDELMKIETCNVDDIETALLVHIPDEKTNNERQFVVGGSLYSICKKYMELRALSAGSETRFFLNYQRGCCKKQPVGINQFGRLASQAAAFLKLPDAKSYTGHCLRRSAGSTLLMDTDLDVKRFNSTNITSMIN